MKLYLAVIKLSVFAVAFGVAAGSVKVTVFYETLCPDSMNFVRYQLYPTWQLLGEELLTVEFVPYGKASQQNTNGSWSFVCQHGPPECQGNKMHACALHYLAGQSATIVRFISCSMSTRDPPNAGAQCANSLGIDFRPIQSCAESDEGDALLAAAGDKTPRLSFVPTMYFNDKFDQQDQDDALRNLMQVVCRKMNGTLPEACTNS